MYYAFEYLGLKLHDSKHEKLFKMVDFNQTGTIDYEEFKEIFFQVCNVRRELEDRNIDAPSFTGRKNLLKILRPVMREEEARERMAIAEADRYKRWLLAAKDKKKILQKADWRAYQELRLALDRAGHLYVIGSGVKGQFESPNVENLASEKYTFQLFERVVELWRDRVKPGQLTDRLRVERKSQEQEEQREAEQNVEGDNELGALGKEAADRKKALASMIDPYKEACDSRFHGLNISMSTCALWGKRIDKCSCSENVIFALSDSGDVYSWGGNNHWWYDIQPDSKFQSKWRGDTTHRSQLLLGTSNKPLKVDAAETFQLEEVSPDDRKAEIIKTVMKYYNQWDPPPNPGQRIIYMEKELMPRIEFDVIKFTIELRGKPVGEATKYQLFCELFEDIALEKKLLGERAHKAIRELETQVVGLLERKKKKLADQIRKKIDDMWKPLREVQAETRAMEKSKQLGEIQNREMKIENDYSDWRDRIIEYREDLEPEYTARGNSLKINLSGVTPRGQDLQTPRGYQAASDIDAGSSHVCLIHKSGQLYTWGSGASGRLGLDLTEKGDPQNDAAEPKVVQSLYGKPVVKASGGFNTTGCIVAGGDLFMWGSAATGKCGLGAITNKEECYVSVPTRVIVGTEDRKIRNISCGYAHTAVVSEAGQLYVYGCGDGGRLGMGHGKYNTLFVPTLVESLAHERIAAVSCGSVTTIVATEIQHEMMGEGNTKFRGLGGGRVYCAGSRNVLGKPHDVFEEVKSLKGLPVKQVAAGFQHNVILTAEGEVYCWGRNAKVCCGSNPKTAFIEYPTLVKCLYERPLNIARGKEARQSSTYSGRHAENAINGSIDGYGLKKCSCTHQDAQPWWDLDLTNFANMDEIKIWNRTDTPHDKSVPQNQYTSRIFPCWVMISNDPFPNFTGQQSLKASLDQAIAKVRFSEENRVSVWRVPAGTIGRYIRVQLEGFNFLNLAEVEVFGYLGHEKGVGRVSHISAGRDVTVAVIRANNDPREIETVYKRAVVSDCANADILRQYETYALEYDKFGRGEILLEQKCVVCRGSDLCELCILKEKYQYDLDQIPLGIGGRRRRLKSIDHFLVEQVKPDLITKVLPRKVRPTHGEIRRAKWKERLTKWFGSSKKKGAKVADMKVEDMDEDEDPAQVIANFRMKKQLMEKANAGEDVLGAAAGTSKGGLSALTKPPPVPGITTSQSVVGKGQLDANNRLAKSTFPNAIQKTIDTTNKIKDDMKALGSKKAKDLEKAKEAAEKRKDPGFGSIT